MRLTNSTTYARIYAQIKKIPLGKVATYSQIAALAGLARQARLVGYALSRQSVESDVPWHRVVNAKGEISYSPTRDHADHLQRVLLEAEGVEFNLRNRIDLSVFGWQPSLPKQKSSTLKARSTAKAIKKSNPPTTRKLRDSARKIARK